MSQEGHGDCFAVALRAQADDPTLTLCHGTVERWTDGLRHWHAWVEETRTLTNPMHPAFSFNVVTCIDNSNGNHAELPQGMYYNAGRIEDVRRYTREEAIRLMCEYKHMGPWDEDNPPKERWADE